MFTRLMALWSVWQPTPICMNYFSLILLGSVILRWIFVNMFEFELCDNDLSYSREISSTLSCSLLDIETRMINSLKSAFCIFAYQRHFRNQRTAFLVRFLRFHHSAIRLRLYDSLFHTFFYYFLQRNIFNFILFILLVQENF